jgi:hypothetical protein
MPCDLVAAYDTARPDDSLLVVGPAAYAPGNPGIPLGLFSRLLTQGPLITLSRPVLRHVGPGDTAETLYDSIVRRLELLKIPFRLDARGRALFGLYLILRTQDRKVLRATYYEECEVLKEGIDLDAGAPVVMDVLTLNAVPREVTKDAILFWGAPAPKAYSAP